MSIFLIYEHTVLFGRRLSQNSENQQIISAKYTVLKVRLRQNERIRTFGIVAAGTSAIHATKLFGCSCVFCGDITE